MGVKISITLEPFVVPNFVISRDRSTLRQEGITETRTYALAELDVETLERLCDDFTNSVFEKAGKRRPPTAN